jgi:hypothetical protein
MYFPPKERYEGRFFHLIGVEGNGYEGSMSADAGIVVSLFALRQLSAQYQSNTFVEHWHGLREFAVDYAPGTGAANLVANRLQ